MTTPWFWRTQLSALQHLRITTFVWRPRGPSGLLARHESTTKSPDRLKRPPRPKWTSEELEKLEELCLKRATSREIQLHLPRRSLNAIDKIRATKGLSRPTWTSEELEKLEELCLKGATSREIQPHLPGRSVRAIDKMRATKGHSRPKWTSEELEKLKELCLKRATSREIQPHLPRRSLYAIQQAAHETRLAIGHPKLPRYTPDEDKRILEAVESGTPLTEINLPGRSQISIVDRYFQKIRAGNHRLWSRPHWTDLEVQMLFALRKESRWSFDMIAQELGKSASAVQSRYYKRVEKYQNTWSRWNDQVVQKLIALREESHWTFDEIARALGKSRAAVTGRYYKIRTSPRKT